MKKLKLASYMSFLLITQTLLGDFNIDTSQSTLNGDSVSAWENFTGLGNNIFASSQVGGTWSPSVPIANPATFPTVPTTAINNSGDMVIVWLGNDTVTSVQSLYGSMYVSGSWVTSLISDPSSEFVIGNYQVKIADNGAIVVTWISYMFSTFSNEARGIYAPTYGTWTPPQTLP